VAYLFLFIEQDGIVGSLVLKITAVIHI